jgi:hypothetical protein
MYKEYDKQRTEDIDPSERRHYPISTISGVSDAEMARPLPKSTVLLKEVKETEVPSGDSNDSKEQTTASPRSWTKDSSTIRPLYRGLSNMRFLITLTSLNLLSRFLIQIHRDFILRSF